MILTTKKLLIREWQDKDKPDLIRNINDLEISKWLLLVPYPYTEKDADWWINHCTQEQDKSLRENYSFAIEFNGEAVGGIGLVHINNGCGEVGYWLGKNFHRQGIMSEALESIIDFAFNKLNLRRLEAGVLSGNPSSGKLLIKYGFEYEGIRKQRVKCKATNQIHDEEMYGLLNQEYKQ